MEYVYRENNGPPFVILTKNKLYLFYDEEHAPPTEIQYGIEYGVPYEVRIYTHTPKQKIDIWGEQSIYVPGVSYTNVTIGWPVKLDLDVFLYTDGDGDYRILTLEELPVYVGRGWIPFKRWVP